MKCVAYCLGAALMVLTACEAQEPANDGQPANEAVQPANQAQPAAKKAAAPKCPDLTTQLPVQASDLTRRTFACVERHALLYAKGPDDIEALPKAVMAKCKDRIIQYVDQWGKGLSTRSPWSPGRVMHWRSSRKQGRADAITEQRGSATPRPDQAFHQKGPAISREAFS